MVFPALCAILTGVLMLCQWGFFLATAKVPELKTRPVEIRFHITSELLTALALIARGAGLLAGTAWSRALYPVSVGAVLYAILNSAGYFAERKVWPIGVMFAVLLGLQLASLFIFWG